MEVNILSKLKFIAILLVLISFLFIIPASFAEDNQTDIALTGGDVDILANDYYFDANIDNDTGDGTKLNPYKELTLSRIEDNSIIHLANGGYSLKWNGYANNVTIIGESRESTVINAQGTTLSASSLTLCNLTLIRAPISASGNLTAINSVFKDSAKSVITSSGNNCYINLINCTFNNNNYLSGTGSAINMKGGYLKITDSVFSNNYAHYSGGAIYADGVNATVSNSKFINDNSLNDAGGAIFIIDSPKFACINVEFNNCMALFGGAVTSLSSNLNLTRSTAKNNKASYYGGAVFAMYDTFTVDSSVFINNSAHDAGALYVDAVDIFNIYSNLFENNYASGTAGAVYSVLSEYFYDSIFDEKLNNTFINNSAAFENDVYASSMINLTIGDGNYNLVRYNASYNGTLPSSYDLRDYNQVTSVKNQVDGGNCWSFSAIAALESAILKATGIDYDLSEENVKNIMAMYSDYGWAMETNVGGYDKMGIGYLTSWLGPVNDTDDVYSGSSLLSPVLHSFYHIQNILFFTRSNYTDNNAIKKAIMDYGAVSTSTRWVSSYANGKSYYYNGTDSDGKDGANHAVAIVGWDDNYSASNFKSTPKGDGAWIIKNSWGTRSGEKGFFYVSYYDTKFAQIGKSVSYVFVFNDTIRFDKNYQYDIAGRTDNFFNTTDTVWYKNRFNATDNEYLAAVSTYFEKETDWDLSVYVNNALKLTQSGHSLPSYSTINLDKVIPLKIGDIFEVIFKITVNGDAGVPISEAVSLNHEIYSSNVSFVSYDGKTWSDFYDLEWSYPNHSYASQVACIKAFTVLEKLNTYVDLKVLNTYNPCEFSATVYTQDGAVVKSGFVTFNIEGKDIKVNIENGVAKLTYLFNDFDNNTVTASFAGEGYVSNSTTTTCDVNYVNLTASDAEVYFLSIISFSAKLTDRYGNAVAGKEIIFAVNNKTYSVKTNSKGLATINLHLNLGSHTVVMGFNDTLGKSLDNLTKTITVKSTIALPNMTNYTYNSSYSPVLLDSNGNVLKNKEVTVIIGNESYNLKTDANGVIDFNVLLVPGTYELTVINPYTGEFKTQTIKVVKRITNNSSLTIYYGSTTPYKVRVYDDNGNVAKGVNMTFKINNKIYMQTTDFSGYASLIISLEANNYMIEASYKGYNVSNKVVVKSTINLNTQTKFTYNSIYSLTLFDSNGVLLKDNNTNIIINGESYNVKTDENGVIDFNVLLAPGIYELTVINPYTGEFKTQTIKVVKRITENKALTMYFGSGSSYKVRVYDDNGNVAKGVKVTFKINGKTYTRTTDSNGYAALKISLQANTYTVEASYKDFNVSNKIVVKPTLILKDKSVKKSKTFSYTVKLLSNKGKILKNKYVKVKFKGKTYKAKTNSKGIATFKIKVNSKTGKFTLTATYGSAKISKKITVKK